MPGKLLDSKSADWSEVVIEESGGFGGLFRGSRLVRAELDKRSTELVDRLLKQVSKQPGVSHLPHPDGQLLSVRVQTVGKSFVIDFDTSELPDAVKELLALAPLRPLPLP